MSGDIILKVKFKIPVLYIVNCGYKSFLCSVVKVTLIGDKKPLIYG